MIDEPQKNHYDGIVAAPVFRKIARETLQYMNIPSKGKAGRWVVSRENEERI